MNSPEVYEGSAHHLAAYDPVQAQVAHQVFDGAASDRNSLTLQLPPDLVCTINPEIGSPNSPNVRHQHFIAAGAGTAKRASSISGAI